MATKGKMEEKRGGRRKEEEDEDWKPVNRGRGGKRKEEEDEDWTPVNKGRGFRARASSRGMGLRRSGVGKKRVEEGKKEETVEDKETKEDKETVEVKEAFAEDEEEKQKNDVEEREEEEEEGVEEMMDEENDSSEEEGKKLQRKEPGGIKCDQCNDEVETRKEMEEHMEKKHEVEEIVTDKGQGKKEEKDFKEIPSVRDYYTRSSWSGKGKQFPTGVTLRSKQTEFKNIIPSMKNMIKKKEGNKFGKTLVKAVTITKTEDKTKYSAILMTVTELKGVKKQKMGKSKLEIYTNEDKTTVTVTNITGSPEENADETAKLLETIIEKLIEGKNLEVIKEEVSKEEKEKEAEMKKKEEAKKKEKKCHQCKKTFRGPANLKIHNERYHNKPCKVCKKSFKSEEELKEHNVKLHKEHETCDKCKKRFVDKEDLRTHIREKHEANIVSTCEVCQCQSYNKATLDEHMKSHEVQVVEKEDKNMRIECGKCKQEFLGKKQMEDHEKTMHKEKTTCRECEEEINNTLEEIEKHMSKHIEEKCGKCSYSNTDKEQLKKHKMKHEAKKPEQTKKGKKVKDNTEYTKKVPEELEAELGQSKRMLKVKGGGACQIDCIAAREYGDTMYGKALKKKVNKYISENLDEFRQYGYSATEKNPFIRENRAGGKFTYNAAFNDEELKKLLVDGDSLEMWGDHEDLQAAAEVIKNNIKVYKIVNNPKTEEEKLWIFTVEPKIKDETKETVELVLVEAEEHFYLVIDKDEELARGCKSSRIENGEEVIVIEKEDKDELKKRLQIDLNRVSDKLRETMEENLRLKEEENRMKRIKEIQELNEVETKKMKINDTKDKERRYKETEDEVDESIHCFRCEHEISSESIGRHERKIHKGKLNFKCEQCEYECDKTAGMQKHVTDKHMLSCDSCGMKTRSQERLDVHKEKDHNEVEMAEVETSNGSEKEERRRSYSETVRDREEVWKFPCHWKRCNKGFMDMNELRVHRAAEHKSSKVCSHFLRGECRYEENMCTFQHTTEVKEEEDQVTCNICGQTVKNMPELFRHRKSEHPANVRSCEAFAYGRCQRVEDCWLIHKLENERKDEVRECKFGPTCNNIRNQKKCFWIHKSSKMTPFPPRTFSQTPFHMKVPTQTPK